MTPKQGQDNAGFDVQVSMYFAKHYRYVEKKHGGLMGELRTTLEVSDIIDISVLVRQTIFITLCKAMKYCRWIAKSIDKLGNVLFFVANNYL